MLWRQMDGEVGIGREVHEEVLESDSRGGRRG